MRKVGKDIEKEEGRESQAEREEVEVRGREGGAEASGHGRREEGEALHIQHDDISCPKWTSGGGAE